MSQKSASKSQKGKEVDEKPRSYNTDWEREPWARGWLTKSSLGNPHKQAFCKVCRKDYRAHNADLIKHSSTQMHVKNMESLSAQQKKLPAMCNVNAKTEEMERDLKLAVYLACHGSIRSADHLCDILNQLKFDNLKLHRTKCANLIKYVIAPNLLQDLINDVGNMPYSLIVDESTDVSTVKYICLCIKYFSTSQNRMVTDFLGLLEINRADADSLYEVVRTFIEEIKLPMSNMTGIGTDGGSNLCGKKHSLYTLLKNDVPSLQIIKCICHALNLAASKASEEFPASFEFLCREIYNWFAVSAKRRFEYKTLWDSLNTLVESSDIPNKVFHQFVKDCDTRWLAKYNSVRIIMEHYFELKTHFNLVVTKEKCYTARQISEMLNDDSTYLYFKIILPILYEINDVNLAFQRSQANISSAYDDLKDLIMLLAQKILIPYFANDDLESIIQSLDNESAYRSVNDADYGIDYTVALKEKKISKEDQNKIESRAFNYIKKLCIQLASRLPEHLKHFQQIRSLSPAVCLSKNRLDFQNLPFLETYTDKTKLGLMQNQYSKLFNVNWTERLTENEYTDTCSFWANVYTYQNAGGKFVFRELALYVLTVMTLPTSNAVVERVFSIMNSIKTKIRNRMLSELLNAILRIKIRLYSKNQCCRNFKPTNAMLIDFNSKTLYAQTTNKDDQAILEKEVSEIEEVLEETFIPCISLQECM